MCKKIIFKEIFSVINKNCPIVVIHLMFPLLTPSSFIQVQVIPASEHAVVAMVAVTNRYMPPRQRPPQHIPLSAFFSRVCGSVAAKFSVRPL